MGAEPIKIDPRIHVMSFKNEMQIYERRLLTSFLQNKLDKPPIRNICYFDAILSRNEEEEWLQFDNDREIRDIRIRFVNLFYLEKICQIMQEALSNQGCGLGYEF